MFLYAPDMERYISRERELLIDYKTLPFPIARDNEELTQCIRQFDNALYQTSLKEFFAKYEIHEDGRAAERAAEFIKDLLIK